MRNTLQTTYRKHVEFNPANEKHRAAYWALRHAGKQDPELRFLMEHGFANVIAMMQAKIADYFSAPVKEEGATVRRLVK